MLLITCYSSHATHHMLLITCYSSHATHHMLRHHIIICIWDARAGCVFRFVVKIMSNIAAARFQHASADCHSYLSVDTCVFDTSSVLMRQIAVSWLVDASGAGAILSVGLFRHPKLKWAKMEKLFNVDGGVSGGTILSCTLLSFHRQPYWTIQHQPRQTSKFWSQICCRSNITNTWIACPHTHTKRLCWNPMHHLWRAMSLYMHLVIANVVCLQLSSSSAMVCHGQQSQQKHACNLRFLPSIVAIWVSTCHNTCITADPLLALAPNSGPPAVVDNQTWLLLK